MAVADWPATRPKIAPLVRSCTRESSAVLVTGWKLGRTRGATRTAGEAATGVEARIFRSKREMARQWPFPWWPCGQVFHGQGDRATSRGSRARIRRVMRGTGRERGRATGRTAPRHEASRSRWGGAGRPGRSGPHDWGPRRRHGAARVLGHAPATRKYAGAAECAHDDAAHPARDLTRGAGGAVVGVGH